MNHTTTMRIMNNTAIATTNYNTDNKPVAVVTASTAGIGLSIANFLAGDGYHVIVSSRKSTNVTNALDLLHSTHGESSASGIPCDVSSPSDRQSLLNHCISQSPNKKISALILNAAASTAFGPILETTESQFDKMFETNVKSVFLTIKQFDSYLEKNIVIISSIAAYNAINGVGVYSVTKTALLGLTKVLANELAKRGIRVNCVAPGIIKTKFSEGLWKDDNSLGRKAIKGGSIVFHIPMKRLGEADDIGGVVAFLLSKHAAYITGETIVVAGGAMSKL